MKHALSVIEMTKAYGSDVVLRGLNLDVPSGSIFGLIGPNGAGKSTLIGCLTGLLEKDSGQIIIKDRELNATNELLIKKDVASVLQPPLLFENFTSYEFTTYVCEMYGTSGDELNDKIKEGIIEQVPLARFGKAEEVADLAAFLASDNANYINGEVIKIDSGMGA